MKLIIKHISPLVTKYHVERFVEPTLNFLFIKNSITNVELLRFKDYTARRIECHAIVTLASEKNVKRIIKLLNNTVLLNEIVSVEKYHQRSGWNDKRESRKLNSFDPVFQGRRMVERRRGSKLIDINNDNIIPIYGWSK